MTRKIMFIVVCFISIIANSQITVNGNVFDEYLEPFSGAIINSEYGNTTSNFEGEFSLNVTSLPVTLKISSVGYSNESVVINDKNQTVNVILKETLGLDQVIISASRTPERIMESPVTVERIGDKQIKNTASHNFYESVRNLKGIDILDNNNSTKIVVSNRGFAALDNVRFVQLADGVDTTVPAFEYSLGNIFGLNELDVKNIEILPGASSALYGANAFNGILLMTSKNPFEHKGLSAYTKAGVSSADERGSAGFYDVGVRYAHKFNDKFAAKINLTYQESEDWLANDLSNITGDGFDHSNGNTNYDGVNVYGDEITLNLVDLALLAGRNAGQNLLPLLSSIEDAENTRISRTGFQEKSFSDYGLNNVLFDFALHFRPNSATELILATKQSTGDNITQSVNRYFQEDSSMQHYRFELQNDNYFVRAYYNKNDSGETYDSKLAGNFITQAWKDNLTFFTEYANTYFGSLALAIPNEDAHNNARAVVDAGMPDDISSFLEEAKNTNIAESGSRLSEKTGFYNVDANWNLSELINFQNLQVGGNFRSFALDSDGQVYTDYDGILRYRQFGLYTQLQRKFADDKLKFSGTLRFDKSRNFDGKFTPRATISYAAGKNKDHNFRLGFQTGFRNPTSRDQYGGLNIGRFVLLGSVNDNLDRYNDQFTLVTDPDTAITLTGRDAFENSFTAASVHEFQTDFRSKLIDPQNLNIDISNTNETRSLENSSLLKVADFDKIKPETVRSFELGYRGAIDLNGGLFEYDLVGYYNIHEDFITETEVVVPLYGDVNDLSSFSTTAIAWNDFQRFQITTNAKSNINVYGFSAGFNTKLFDKLNFAGSYAFSDFNLDQVENDIAFKPSFNTPKHSVKVQLNTGNLFNNFGFGVDTRWQDEFLYQTRIVDRFIEERITVDAQVNYTIPSIKSIVKLGAINISGKEYFSSPETGIVGSQFYISWVINN